MTRSLRSTARCCLPSLRTPAAIAGMLLVAVFTLLYGLTLDNGLRPAELEGGDLITHQYAQVQARFGNAPGYPLYTMGGWLWFRLGRLLFGADANPLPILSSYSTFWALLALALLYALSLEALRRLPRPDATALGKAQRESGLVSASHEEPNASRPEGAQWDWLVAFLATVFYGVTYFFWYYAVTTEQYTSSVAWTLAVFLLAFRWERLRSDRYLLGLALLTGVGLSHQITVLAAVPPIVVLVLSRDRGIIRRGRLVAALFGLALLPLLSYAYVYLRGVQHPEWQGSGQWTSTWQWFWSFVATAQGRNELTWSIQPFFTDEFPALMWREMTLPGLVVGLLGWLTLDRRRTALLYATFVIYLVFCWVDRLGNWYQVIMPVYALLAVGIAAAAARAVRAFKRFASGSKLAGARPAVLLALTALIAYRATVSYPRADCRNRPEDTGLAPAWAILVDDPPPEAAILATQPEALALSYVTQIWMQRPDLEMVVADEAYMRLVGAGLVVTQAALPLLSPEVLSEGHFSALGRTLVRVSRTGTAAIPAGMSAWAHDFGGQVRLVGGTLERNPVTHEQVVLLAWQLAAVPRQDWSVSVRLTQGDREIAQSDSEHPVFGAYPMSRWTPGEVVLDPYAFAEAVVAGADGVKVLLYSRVAGGSFTNLDEARFTIRRQLAPSSP